LGFWWHVGGQITLVTTVTSHLSGSKDVEHSSTKGRSFLRYLCGWCRGKKISQLTTTGTVVPTTVNTIVYTIAESTGFASSLPEGMFWRAKMDSSALLSAAAILSCARERNHRSLSTRDGLSMSVAITMPKAMAEMT